MAAQADPITLELFKNAIFSIADEMALTVCRTTYSGVLKDNMDYSTGFADADGKLAAQGLALLGHLGSVPTAMAAIMRRFKDDIAPGKLAARVGSPALREKHKPGLLAGAGAQLRFLLRKSAPSPNWKSLDPFLAHAGGAAAGHHCRRHRRTRYRAHEPLRRKGARLGRLD
jgi:hypothetical protein